jgi:SWI/SNF-related matrix-associated actin-dependent regulator of chromatin subfamily A-like protein 1
MPRSRRRSARSGWPSWARCSASPPAASSPRRSRGSKTSSPQRALLARFPTALHLLGEDTLERREAAIRAFQRSDGPQLIVCATRVAAQGITLTRASNVAFLELEWTPAMHDQAEDRCHRIGQRDAVTAWYLLAANTIDETMARLIQSKRAIVAAVTDGRVFDDDALLDGVVRELREGRPFTHLRAVS